MRSIPWTEDALVDDLVGNSEHTGGLATPNVQAVLRLISELELPFTLARA